MNVSKNASPWEILLKATRFRDTTVYQTQMYDGRNAFENDYTRITLSPHFRRLQDKTQVFPYDNGDFVRTRLTHSLEVSTFARSMGLWVEKHLVLRGEYPRGLEGYMPSVLAAAGLVHDIGNPPFGHFGEACIREFFIEFFEKKTKLDAKKSFADELGLSEDEKADFTKFDGNAQTFRVLRKLGPSHDEYSYNLTYALLSCIIKYPFSSLKGNRGGENENKISEKGFGYFQSEEKEYHRLATELNLVGRRHPLVYILEAADDIAYSVSDIEDGCKKNIISEEYLREIITTELSQEKALGLLKMIDVFKKEISKDHPAKFGVLINRFRIEAQSQMIIAAQKCFLDNYTDIMNGTFDRDLLKSSAAADIRKLFEKLGKKNFHHDSVLKREIAGRSALLFLLREFSDAIFSPNLANKKSFEHKIHSMISDNYRFINSHFETYPNKNYLKLMLLIDFISGMTDSFALRTYHELSCIAPF
jgi:dGTPase